MKKKVTAVIIARKNSRRIPNKLHKKLNGKSLIEIKISQLLKVNIDEIIVGSDDLKLNQICKKFKNKKIKFIKRSSYYCNEKLASANDVIKNMLSYFKTDIVLWAYPTNPFTTERHYNEALKIYFQKIKEGYDGLFSVNKCLNYYWGFDKKPINHNPLEKKHTLLSENKIKPLYSDNGAIFIRDYKKMKKDGRHWSKKGVMFVMDEREGWDINYPWDLEVCQLKSFNKKKF
jgi:CMP-N-acetylneuraminic acid synthetase